MRYLTAWCGVSLPVAALAAGGGPSRSISKIALEDRIRGGWAGKMIGVSYGAPTEFRWNGRINDGEITWSPERVSNALGQDDLYVGMTMAETMDRLSFDATAEQYGEAFKAGGAGAEAVLTFTGTAVSVIGGITPAGGCADVYLDGKPAASIDAYAAARTHDNALWYAYGLAEGRHTIRIVTRADADARSTGKDVSILEAVVYRGRE